MKVLLKSLSVFAIFAFLAGPVVAGEPVNTKCPVTGKAVDAEKVVEYTVKFCCGKCVKKFNEDPLAYVEKISKAEEGKCAFSGKALDDDATATVQIGVCCGKCEKKVTKDPGKYFGKLEKAS